MDAYNRLCLLGMAIGDARDAIEAACREADALLVDMMGPDDYDEGWPALNRMVDALAEVKAKLAAMPGEEMTKAIVAADEYLDDMGDRADALSY